MTSLAQQLDAMFGGLAPDDSGQTLRVAAACLNQSALRGLWLIDHQGHQLASHQVGDDVLATPPAALVRQALDQPDLHHGEVDELWLAAPTGPGLDGVLLTRLSPWHGDAEACHARLRLLAPLAALASSNARQAALDQARVRQLTREQATLHERYTAAAHSALEERERSLAQERDHREKLETEVARRSAELREALVQARLASQAKTDFLANMSHEIRTPLNAMLGYTDLLLRQAPDEATSHEWLRTIALNGQHLLHLINDILDLSRLESGTIQVLKAPCDPARIVRQTCDLLSTRCQQKHLTMECSIDPEVGQVITDPTRLHQILNNLLNNAVKFTERGKVGVRAHLLAATGEPGRTAAANERLLVLEVYDTGIGIAPEAIPRLFQPFEQADNSLTRQFGGSGLGLALSQHLAGILGGRIECQSTMGQGTTMTLRIRVEMAPQGANPSPVPAASTPAAAKNAGTALPPTTRILVAEDGQDNRTLIKLILKHAGVTPVVVENGQQAVQAVLEAQRGNQPFDVVLMDLQMPVLDGYQATREIRSAGGTMPIIAVTAHAMAGDRERSLQAGCNEHITKPIDRVRLLSSIVRLLSAAQRQQEPPKP